MEIHRVPIISWNDIKETGEEAEEDKVNVLSR